MKTFLPLSALMLCCGVASAQYSIGTNATDPAALFELKSSTKGFLPPRMTFAQRTALPNLADGLIVYQTDASGSSAAGLYVYSASNSTWTAVGAPSSSSGSDWSLTGNAGTVDGTNFLGTTDNVPLNLRVNSTKAGRIESDANTGNVSYGLSSQLVGTASASFDAGIFNTSVGTQSLQANYSGARNTAVGNQALRFNFYGRHNTAVGASAGFNNDYTLLTPSGTTGGNRNTYIGAGADSANVVGNNITAVGFRAGYTNSGSFNAFLGANAGTVGTAPLTYATAIGADAAVSVNNGLVLGTTDAAASTTKSSYVGINVTDPTQRIDFRNGHIRNRQDNLPTINTPLPSGTGVTSASATAGSSDVRGRIITVGFNNASGVTQIRLNFAYPATNPPIVTITPANESASNTTWYVTSDSFGFDLFFRNPTAGSVSPAHFNYMIIE